MIIDNFNKELDKEDIYIEYIGNINISTSQYFNNGNMDRLRMILPYIQNYIQNNPDKHFKIAIALGDNCEKEYSAPTLCFSKSITSNSILIPNIDFFSGLILGVINESSRDIDYTNKLNSSIFVGSSTGPLENNTRILYGQKCLKLHSHICVINNLCQSSKDEWERLYPFVTDLLGPPQDIKSQLKHKIAINIDGNTMCWSRLYWQMNSNSIPVYINKITDRIQFFDVKDTDKCYVSTSLDNSIDTIDNILYNYKQEEIDLINNNGQNYCKKYFEEYITNPVKFLQNTINNIFTKILI